MKLEMKVEHLVKADKAVRMANREHSPSLQALGKAVSMNCTGLGIKLFRQSEMLDREAYAVGISIDTWRSIKSTAEQVTAGSVNNSYWDILKSHIIQHTKSEP